MLDHPSCPLLSDSSKCNCRSGKYGPVLLSVDTSQCVTEEEIESDMDEGSAESDEDVAEDTEEETYPDDLEEDDYFDSIEMKCSGSVFERFQKTLKELKLLGKGVCDVPIVLQFEQDNVRDCNAILFVVEASNENLGYVDLPHIPRVTQALKLCLITKVHIVTITGRYHRKADKVILSAYCAKTRKGKWPKPSPDNTYYTIVCCRQVSLNFF